VTDSRRRFLKIAGIGIVVGVGALVIADARGVLSSPKTVGRSSIQSTAASDSESATSDQLSQSLAASARTSSLSSSEAPSTETSGSTTASTALTEEQSYEQMMNIKYTDIDGNPLNVTDIVNQNTTATEFYTNLFEANQALFQSWGIQGIIITHGAAGSPAAPDLITSGGNASMSLSEMNSIIQSNPNSSLEFKPECSRDRHSARRNESVTVFQWNPVPCDIRPAYSSSKWRDTSIHKL
jgi:hypothetical protein